MGHCTLTKSGEEEGQAHKQSTAQVVVYVHVYVLVDARL